MAAKKPKAPKKFKQARSAAKADAKAAFSGKVQARRKDITGKLTAEDKQVLREVSKESRAGIITGPDGKPINVGKPAETAAERFDREGRQAREKFRAQMREEGLYPPEKGATSSTPKSAPKAAPAKAAKKPASNLTPAKTAAKPAAKPAAKTAATRAEKSAANKAAWAKMTPEERKNWKSNKPGAAKAETPAKPKVNKPSTKSTGIAEGGELKTASQVKTYKDAVASGKSKGEAMRLAQGKTTGTSVAVRPKGTVAAKTKEVATTTKPTAAGTVAGKVKRFGKIKGVAKAGVIGALISETGSALKGSSEKDFKEIQRLENKLAVAKGQAPKYKNMGSNKNPIAAMKADLGNIASLSTMGLIGKTRRERMDELNAKIAKAQAKKDKAAAPAPKSTVKPAVNTYASGKKVLAPSHVSSSKANINIAAGGATSKATQGSTYTVTKGDTLSGIAKAAGVSLSDIHAANPIFKKNAKYKQGNMIWSGTKVKIPTIKK